MEYSPLAFVSDPNPQLLKVKLARKTMYGPLTFFSDYLLPGIIFLPWVCLAVHNDLGARQYFGAKKSFCKDKEGCEIMLKELKEGRQRVFPVFFFWSCFSGLLD